MRRCAIDDYARGEIAVVEVGIRFAEFGHHLVELVSENATHIRDQLRQRRGLHFTCSCRFARRRFGHYDVIDFLAVLFGYVINGERTLEEFYERLQPFAVPFMALFERDRLPSRSALSRFLAALTEEPVEALRTLFLDDLLARPLTPDK